MRNQQGSRSGLRPCGATRAGEVHPRRTTWCSAGKCGMPSMPRRRRSATAWWIATDMGQWARLDQGYVEAL